MSGADALAIHSLDDAFSQTHKLVARAAIVVIVFAWFFAKFLALRRRAHALVAITVYICYNAAILPLSDNAFYSASRLFEFGLLALSAFVIVNTSADRRALDRVVHSIFIAMSFVLAASILVFFVNPELGAKVAGWDDDAGAMKVRLGGPMLRVDLIAALSGASALYWLFATPHAIELHPPTRILHAACAAVTLALAHSRSALLLVTAILLFYFLRSHLRASTKLLVGFGTLIIISVLSVDAITSFYLRGESSENLLTMSGRTIIASSLLDLNSLTDLLIGNGYLMNWREGLFFPVPEMGVYMASPHNGYLAVLLGSGVPGLIIVATINLQLIRNTRRATHPSQHDSGWHRPVYVFLALVTLFDYGVWGVTSPALLVFMLTYFSAALLRNQSAEWPPSDHGRFEIAPLRRRTILASRYSVEDKH
jgi:hypothetical protein